MDCRGLWPRSDEGGASGSCGEARRSMAMVSHHGLPRRFAPRSDGLEPAPEQRVQGVRPRAVLHANRTPSCHCFPTTSARRGSLHRRRRRGCRVRSRCWGKRRRSVAQSERVAAGAPLTPTWVGLCSPDRRMRKILMRSQWLRLAFQYRRHCDCRVACAPRNDQQRGNPSRRQRHANGGSPRPAASRRPGVFLADNGINYKLDCAHVRKHQPCRHQVAHR